MSAAVLRGGSVVIVGGGVIGLSIAYHLTKRGYQDVVVVERGMLAAGATAKATGGIRQQFSSAVNIALSRRAVDYFEHFAERVGEPIDFRQHGYLFLLDREEQLAVFRANAARQRAAGVPVEILDPREILSIMPHVRIEDLVGASYCPTDGSASPSDVAHAFARQARAGGARVLEETTVIGIERDANGAVTAVETTAGDLPAELVVNAAGPWASEIGRLVDVDVPVEPHRRQAFGIKLAGWPAGDLPLTVDFATGAYVHPEVDGGVIGGADRETPAGFRTEVDWDVAMVQWEALIHRIPLIADAEIRRGWAGLREMTPDDHGILGPTADVPGFWLATGFSGHGFMHAPIVGELLSEWLLDGVPSIALSPLRLERFASGAAIREAAAF